MGTVVTTALKTATADTLSRLHTGASGASYDTYMDRFGRVIKNAWTKNPGGGGGTVTLYGLDLTYDRNGNITSDDDGVLNGGAGFDVKYAMDNLNRLVDADEGTLSTGSITSRTRREKWDGGGLSPTGNWLRHKLDLDGNGSYAGTGEMDDTGTFNKANEWLTRDLDSTPGTTGDNYTVTHDDVGNMTNDGKSYKYDAFGRLMQIRNQSNNLVVEYMYDGLGQRTGWHADWDADGTVESSNDDPWYFFVYDDRWRIVGTYRVTSATITSGTVDTYDKPKEQFVYHHAGADGRGGSSYIDSVILRDRDANNAWTAAGDTTLEERLFYAQNWRADVSLILNTNGRPIEKVKYSAYGVALPWTDLDYNNDGILSPDDSDDFITTPYDWDLDGDTDATDSTSFVADYGSYTTTKGVRGEVSLTTIGNRKGYAGYEFDGATKQYHVRHRVYVPEMGRWTRRDPIGYVDGISLYRYAMNRPVVNVDSDGRVVCVAGAVAGIASGFIELITGGSARDILCAAAGGAATGACSTCLCIHVPIACVWGSCLCGAAGNLIEQFCAGSVNTSDPCFWWDLATSTVLGCLGGAVFDESEFVALMHALGLLDQSLSFTCRRATQSAPPAPTTGPSTSPTGPVPGPAGPRTRPGGMPGLSPGLSPPIYIFPNITNPNSVVPAPIPPIGTEPFRRWWCSITKQC